MLKPEIVTCLLTKFGKGAEHSTEKWNAHEFKVYLDPDDVEEGERKIEVFTSFLDDEEDVKETGELDDNHVIGSENQLLAERTLVFLQQCASASQTASGRRKSRKSRGKAKKTRKQVRRR